MFYNFCMKLCMAQMSMSKDMDVNFQKTIEFIEQARNNDLLFFPEVQLTPFFAQYPHSSIPVEYSMKLDDKRIQSIQQLSKEYDLMISPNLYIEDKNQYYDMSLFMNEGEIQGISKMVHILNAEQFYEQDVYTPSEDGFKVYDTKFGKVGIVICFDRHLPESIRTCAVNGAQLVIVPTANTKAEPLDLFEWEMRVQAYQNGVFIAMCNRIGKEGDMDFAGESLVIDPDGNVLLKADDKEQLLSIEIDLKQSIETRKKRPYLNLRRKEFYD